MKTVLVLACAAAALTLGGCASLSGSDRTEAIKMGLQHIEGCDRTYTGGTGVGAAFTFNITCKATAPAAAP